MNRLRFNYGIYEYDILFFGGTIEYTGKVIAKSRRSRIEEAVITINTIQCCAYFERFRHGNAALICFSKDGVPIHKSDLDTYPLAHLFLSVYSNLAEKSDHFLEFMFMRRIKQYSTFILQLLCSIMLIGGIYLIMRQPVQFIRGGILIIGSSFLIAFLCSLYKYYRLQRPADYKPWLFTSKKDSN